LCRQIKQLFGLAPLAASFGVFRRVSVAKVNQNLTLRATMVCACTSDNQSSFNSEIAIHFSGLKGLDKPIVWVFPKLIVCLECGSTEFIVPERELRVLVQGAPLDGAVVLPKNAANHQMGRTNSPPQGIGG
jgi:hypothetical protein